MYNSPQQHRTCMMNERFNEFFINKYIYAYMTRPLFCYSSFSVMAWQRLVIVVLLLIVFFPYFYKSFFFLYSLPILHSTCAHRSSTSIRWNEFNLYKNSIYWANHECEEDEKITVNDAEELNEEYWPFGFGRVVYQQWMRLSQHSCTPRIKILIYGIVH